MSVMVLSSSKHLFSGWKLHCCSCLVVHSCLVVGTAEHCRSVTKLVCGTWVSVQTSRGTCWHRLALLCHVATLHGSKEKGKEN